MPSTQQQRETIFILLNERQDRSRDELWVKSTYKRRRQRSLKRKFLSLVNWLNACLSINLPSLSSGLIFFLSSSSSPLVMIRAWQTLSGMQKVFQDYSCSSCSPCFCSSFIPFTFAFASTPQVMSLCLKISKTLCVFFSDIPFVFSAGDKRISYLQSTNFDVFLLVSIVGEKTKRDTKDLTCN